MFVARRLRENNLVTDYVPDWLVGLHPGADHFFVWYIALVVNSVVALTLFVGIGAGMSTWSDWLCLRCSSIFCC